MITFARTRHYYDSYTDFWRLVELAGFPICFVDEVDLYARQVYITTMVDVQPGGEWGEMVAKQSPRRRAHLILWNLERPFGWAKTVMNYNARCHMLLNRRWFDEIWVSDRRLAAESDLRFVVLGSHPELGTPGTIKEKRFAFCHMSAPTNRRQSIYKLFSEEDIGPNSWAEQRDRVLKESRFALNVHQDNHPFQEPLRFALFAAYGLPILSETIFDSHPWNEQVMVWDKFPYLAGHLRAMLENDYRRWYKMGQRARSLMTVEWEFGKTVRQAVRESVTMR